MSLKLIHLICALLLIGAFVSASAGADANAPYDAANNSTTTNSSITNSTGINATINTTINTTINVTINDAAIAATNETVQNETVVPENAIVLAPIEAAPQENETAPAQNETAPAQNETAPQENATVVPEVTQEIAPVGSTLGTSALVAGPMQIGSSVRAAFDVSGAAGTPQTFSINGQPLHQEAYTVGLPAKTIMDLSALPFFINKI